jgi:hypothetical protein
MTRAHARKRWPPMPELGYCKPCRDKGHNCETRLKDLNEEFICIFCADGVDCPVMEQAKRRRCAHAGCGAPLIPDNPTKFCSRHMPAAEMKAFKESKRVPSNGSSSKRSKAPKEVKEETTMEEQRVCSVEGCGKKLIRSNKSGRCSAHNYVRKTDRPSPVKSGVTRVPPASRFPNRTAKCGPLAARAAAAGCNGVATISVPEAALDRFWSGLSVEEKASAFTEYLGRE